MSAHSESRASSLSLHMTAMDFTRAETEWAAKYDWLLSLGYQLRPRFRRGWVPSWKGTDKNPRKQEDGRRLNHAYTIDAIRVSDGVIVALKLIDTTKFTQEVDVGLFFSSGTVASDPRNHCVPVYEVVDVPEVPGKPRLRLMVMPYLRPWFTPRFDTVGEVLQFFREIFMGLQFMHEHHVAHRDITCLNVMMDASDMYPQSWHSESTSMKRDFSGLAKHYTRSQRPVRYYLIDFGLSRRYDPNCKHPSEPQWMGGDKTVPEFLRSREPCDPFPTDVYCIGNLIRQEFWGESPKLGFEFMQHLVGDMTHDDPTQRPTMDAVVQRFELICRELSSWKLRSRVIKAHDHAAMGVFRHIAHWTRRLRFIATSTPAIPIKKPS